MFNELYGFEGSSHSLLEAAVSVYVRAEVLSVTDLTAFLEEMLPLLVPSRHDLNGK
jgi:hypothetical protein